MARESPRAVVVQEYDVAGDRGRFTVQRRALELLLSDPVGVGPSQSGEVLGIPPHNVYLHVLTEAGWVGGSAFLLFVLLTLANGLRLCLVRSPFQIASTVVFAALVGTLAQSLFIDSTHWRHLFVLFAIVWGTALARPAAPSVTPGARAGAVR